MFKVNLYCISTRSRLKHANHAILLSYKVGSVFFVYHFTAVQLFAASKFLRYQNSFPITMLTETIRVHPFFDRERLRNELSVS